MVVVSLLDFSARGFTPQTAQQKNNLKKQNLFVQQPGLSVQGDMRNGVKASRTERVVRPGI